MDLFKEIWCDIFTPDWSMVELGEELSKRYSTWLVSNTNSAHYEWLMEKYPRVGFYRDAGLSYELGAMKPDEIYYQRALERFGANANESVFIDDLEANVKAASRAGFHGVLFKDIHSLKRELASLGISLSAY
jgi:putative hydrolase of the HAD superfamily